ncbi:agmatinase [Amaricoccus sp.]|uniref:agmatinase n=1 Tax=Amaricoccus sp. TaxID=1872485 RepID=UPI001B5E3AA4|nr:agmatinase [Amaricoccus sp.]MBP7002972.1 agmatinase [Amaricoccus sp.]
MAWDETKLARLRERYGDDPGGRMYDPKFAKVAERVFSRGARPAPWVGVPTFLSAPFRQVDRAAPDFSGLAVAISGAPMDIGVSNRPGARFGPRALRAIERIGPYNHFLDCAPTYELAVADVGDVPFPSRYDLHASHAAIEAWIRGVVDAGAAPLTVGGDHSITHPILRAVGRDRPVGLVHIDAHSDTGGPFDNERFNHGAPFRNAVLDGVLDPERVIQIGLRGSSEYLYEFATESGMTCIHAEEVAEMGIPAVIEKARAVAQGPVYLSFDIDVLDPAFAPGTGTPEIGGLTTREAQAILRGLKGLDIVGGDVVEVAPQYDATTNTAQAGAQMLFEILSLMAFSPSIAGRA